MGDLIVIEGIDGSGKSTQFKLLADRLTKEGLSFTHVTFPQYSEPSSTLVKMYLNGDFGTHPDDVNAYAASSFYAVDRYASFKRSWQSVYENGGFILMDRYTTSNAIHQGSKLPPDERGNFFRWLYDYEFDCLKLPRPDMVIYLDVSLSEADRRRALREKETGTDADIHERDNEYLKKCLSCAAQASKELGWTVISSEKDGSPRSIEDIHEEIYALVKEHLAKK